jgi:hypothetical protein
VLVAYLQGRVFVGIVYYRAAEQFQEHACQEYIRIVYTEDGPFGLAQRLPEDIPGVYYQLGKATLRNAHGVYGYTVALLGFGMGKDDGNGVSGGYQRSGFFNEDACVEGGMAVG